MDLTYISTQDLQQELWTRTASDDPCKIVLNNLLDLANLGKHELFLAGVYSMLERETGRICMPPDWTPGNVL